MSCKYNNCKICGYKSECEIYKENAELKDYRLTTLAKQQSGMSKYALNLEHKLSWYDEQLTKAKEIIRDLINLTEPTSTEEVQHWNETFRKAEKFLSEVEK